MAFDVYEAIRKVQNLTLAEKYNIAIIDCMKQHWPDWTVSPGFIKHLEIAYRMAHERTDSMDKFFDTYGKQYEEEAPAHNAG